MSKKQIKTDFDRLYVGKDTAELVEGYYRKKKKDMFLIAAAGAAILLALLAKTVQEREIGEGLRRNGFGEGEKEVLLEVAGEEGDWEGVTVMLEEKEYTEEEIDAAFAALAEELPELILGENQSLEEVTKDLALATEVEGYPLYLGWSSSEPDIIDASGGLNTEGLTEEKLICLTVRMSYGEWIREHSFYVRASPKEQAGGFLARLSAELAKREEGSRKEEQFSLPESLDNSSLSWRYPLDKTVFVLCLLFPVLLAVLWREKDREIRKRAEEKQESLRRSYPELASKLILLMEAGMTAKGALFRIAGDKETKREGGKPQYLYEELGFVCRQMQNGMGETEGYELLGRRCQLPEYRKLSTLLIQYVQRGAAGMMDTLRQESWQANEERKNRVKRLGEEAGTKLLLPMMLMLGIVMTLIIVPACFTF